MSHEIFPPTLAKVFSLNDQHTLSICISKQSIDGVDQFVYVSIVVFIDSSSEFGVTRPVSSIRPAFAAICKIWKNS